MWELIAYFVPVSVTSDWLTQTTAPVRGVRPGVFDNEQFFNGFCFLPKLTICYFICSVYFEILTNGFGFG